MKRFLRFLGYLIFCTFFVFGAGRYSCLTAQDDISLLVNKIQSSVASIESLDKGGKIFNRGNGFIINERGDIITHSKIFHNAQSIQVKNIQGNINSVTKILAEDKEGGLVMLAVENYENEVSPLSLSIIPPKANERIMVVSGQFGAERSIVNGVVSDIFEIPLFGKVIKLKASLPLNYCGSPVINMNGEVVGMMAFVSSEGYGYALSCERIENFFSVRVQPLSERIGVGIVSEEEFYREGIFLIGNTEYEKAISSFEKAIGKNHDYVNAYFQIGYCKNKLGKYPDAIKDLKQAISLNRELPEAYFQLGLSYFMQKQYQDAVESLLNATRINSKLFEAYFMLGLSHTALEQHREAVEAYRQAIRVNKNVPEAYFHLGIAYLQIENKLMAFEEYKVLKNMNKHLASKLYQMIYQ